MAKKKKAKKVEQNTQSLTSTSIKISFIAKHPYWMALSVVAILILIFYHPIFFQGKTLLPPDNIASRSFQAFSFGAIKNGTYPLWNPFICGGMPSFGSLSSAPFLDIINSLIYLIGAGIFWLLRLGDSYYFVVGMQLLLNSLLLGSAVYALMKHFGVNQSAALYSSIAIVFLPQVIAYPAFGHNSKLNTFVFIPFILLMLHKVLAEKKLIHLALMGLAVGMQLMRAHIQICYYTYLMIGIYVIYWFILAIRDKRGIKELLYRVGLVVIALVAGFLYSSVMSFSVWEYADFSIRGGGITGGLEYSRATGWSFPPSEIATYFVPSFMGFGKETYWGAMPFTDFPLYFGLITFILAGLGFILKNNRETRFFAILAGIALFVSFGKHLPFVYGPMYKFLPLFNKFRAPKMIQIMLMFSMVVLAGFGIQGILEILKEKTEKKVQLVTRYLLVFGGIIALLLLFLLIGEGTYLNWAKKVGEYRQAAYDKAISDAFKALFLWASSFALIMMTLRKKIKSSMLPITLIILLLFDVWPISKRFLQYYPKAQAGRYFQETPDVSYLKQKQAPFRMIGIKDQRDINWYMYHHLENAFGYQGAKLKLYDELTTAFGLPSLHEGDAMFQKYLKVENGQYTFRDVSEVSRPEIKRHNNFLKLMNVKYVVCPYPLPDTSFQMVFMPSQRGANGILAFRDALPRVYFPQEIRTLADAKSVLNDITLPEFDPIQTSFIEEDAPFEIVDGSENQADITSFDIHHIRIHANIETPACMVLSEMYYPAGWKASVDGKEAHIYKTNYAFRSLFLEPGEHNIEFVFSPLMFKAGFAISVSTFLLLLGGIYWGWKKSKRENQPITEG